MRSHIKTKSAISISDKIVLLKDECNDYFLGLKCCYIGPRHSLYEDIGACYIGPKLREITEEVANVLSYELNCLQVANIAEYPDDPRNYYDKFAFRDIIEAAKVIGWAEALDDIQFNHFD